MNLPIMHVINNVPTDLSEMEIWKKEGKTKIRSLAEYNTERTGMEYKKKTLTKGMAMFQREC